jgi:hypothetical protein
MIIKWSYSHPHPIPIVLIIDPIIVSIFSPVLFETHDVFLLPILKLTLNPVPLTHMLPNYLSGWV